MPITTGISQTLSTDSTTTTTSTTITPLPAVALINLILADVNAILPNFNGLVSSYRLLVGAAEEVYRTPEVCHDVFERAVRRYDNTGLLIDVLLELLCCKIVFSSELLQVTCGPVDLIRHLLTCLCEEDTPCISAQTVVGLEALKRLQDKFWGDHYCLPDHDVLCPKPLTPPPLPAPPAAPIVRESDIAEIVEAKLIGILSKYAILAGPPIREEQILSGETTRLATADTAGLDGMAGKRSAPEENLRYTSRLHPKYSPGAIVRKKKNQE